MKKDVIAEYESEVNGQKVTVQKLRTKDRRVIYNAPRRISVCPNCSSSIKLDANGLWECTGDRLRIWESEFARYHAMSNEDKITYIKNTAADGKFLELYDRWAYSIVSEKPEEYNCGYTNKIFLPIASNKVLLKDPLYIKHLEGKVGRKLTEEEIAGEAELWYYGGMILKDYRKGARRVRIPTITLPDDV